MIIDHFSRTSRLHPTPTRAVCYALLRGYAKWVLLGACNLMVCLIWGFRAVHQHLGHPDVAAQRDLAHGRLGVDRIWYTRSRAGYWRAVEAASPHDGAVCLHRCHRRMRAGWRDDDGRGRHRLGARALLRTRLLGPIFTICTALSWMGVGIHR